MTQKDLTTTGQPKLKKIDASNYSWRDWTIVKNPQGQGYVCTHQSQVVGNFPDLAAVKRELLLANGPVVLGQVPAGFAKTDKRQRQDYLRSPVQERRALVNQRVRGRLQEFVAGYETKRQKFLDDLTKHGEYLRYTIEWHGYSLVEREVEAQICRKLLARTDDELPSEVKAKQEDLLQELLISSYDEGQTSPFHRAAATAERKAHRRMYEKLSIMVLMYQRDNVPTGQEEYDDAK